ncbi:MAG: hypothetical protein K6G15_00335 [Desulfovibrio sp.]|nr:hypothetical protein [Desulfovibrio sp.]
MRYELMLFDETLLAFDATVDHNPRRPRKINISFIGNEECFPVALCCPSIVPLAARLDRWLDARITMTGQKLVRKIRALRKLQDPLEILAVTHGLSLTDAFWIRKECEDCRWGEINLYANDFSELEGILLSGEDIDHINGKYLSPDFTTDGRMRKSWIRDERGIFLVKTDMMQGLFSQASNEWLAARAAEAFGIAHVPYSLKCFGKDRHLASECPRSRTAYRQALPHQRTQ